jgi:hypothetical protein
LRLYINNDSLKAFTKNLEKMHRSALPVAIRGTLNDAVYDVKTKTMPRTASEFKKRQPNFFKANSKFEKAVGFDVPTMKATVGFYENKLAHQSTNYAVKDLEQQEYGGAIKKKSLIAMRTARVNNKMVMANARLSSLKGKTFIKVSSIGKGKFGKRIHIASRKQMFIRAAIQAEKMFGKNAFVLGNRNGNGSRTLSRINEIRTSGRFTKNNPIEINSTPLYNVKKGRVTNVSATNFMKRASMATGLNINRFYIAQAQRQFEKFKQ